MNQRPAHTQVQGFVCSRRNQHAKEHHVAIFDICQGHQVDQSYVGYVNGSHRYIVRCEAHRRFMGTATYQIAREMMKEPDFCPVCMGTENAQPEPEPNWYRRTNVHAGRNWITLRYPSDVNPAYLSRDGCEVKAPIQTVTDRFITVAGMMFERATGEMFQSTDMGTLGKWYVKKSELTLFNEAH